MSVLPYYVLVFLVSLCNEQSWRILVPMSVKPAVSRHSNSKAMCRQWIDASAYSYEDPTHMDRLSRGGNRHSSAPSFGASQMLSCLTDDMQAAMRMYVSLLVVPMPPRCLSV